MKTWPGKVYTYSCLDFCCYDKAPKLTWGKKGFIISYNIKDTPSLREVKAGTQDKNLETET